MHLGRCHRGNWEQIQWSGAVGILKRRDGIRRGPVNYTLDKRLYDRKSGLVLAHEIHSCWIYCLCSSILRDKIRLFLLLANSFQENIWLLRNIFVFTALTFTKSNEGIVKIVDLYWNYICIFTIAEVPCCQYIHFLKEN